jgi:hypothetical protein
MNAFSQLEGGGRGGRTAIPARFNGPPGTGNGGWSAGTFAIAAGARAGGPPIEVTLRMPPPLDTELTVVDGAVLHGESVVAEMTAAEGDLIPVDAVGPETAAAASRHYAGFTRHPFPTCYVCGPQRPDGLRIFPGPLPGGRTPAPRIVPDGVDLTTVWAALDCPGGWTAIQDGSTYVLGRIAAFVDRLPEPGSACIVVGAAIEIAGRKAKVNSTVYAPEGHRIATARATWIATT